MPSSAHPRLVLISDVDGTLLDANHQLPWPPAQLRQHIATLARRIDTTVQLALASSRTLRELVVLQRAIGLPGPCIAEDGAVLAIDDAQSPGPGATLPHDTALRPWTSAQYGQRIMHRWHQSRTATQLRRDFADLPAVARVDAARQSIATQHALGFETAGARRRALVAREHSLLLVPEQLTEHEHHQLRDTATQRGAQLRRGGRWLTLAATEGKGDAVRLLGKLSLTIGVPPMIAVAIGNEENDVSLLREAHLRFVIRNPGRGPHPALAALPQAIVLDTEGPGGWMEMLTRLESLIGPRSTVSA